MPSLSLVNVERIQRTLTGISSPLFGPSAEERKTLDRKKGYDKIRNERGIFKSTLVVREVLIPLE